MATTKYKQPQPVNLPLGQNGYPQTGIKTSGIKIRGTGAAQRGVMARGPMGGLKEGK